MAVSKPVLPAPRLGWWHSGTPWIWLHAGAISLCICMTLWVVGLIAVKGLGHFWPRPLILIHYQAPDGPPGVLLGEIHAEERLPAGRAGVADWEVDPESGRALRYLVKVGNRELYGLDFRWVSAAATDAMETPDEALVLRRRKGGDVYGFLQGLVSAPGAELQVLDASSLAYWLGRSRAVEAAVTAIEKGEINRTSRALEALRIERRGLERRGLASARDIARIEAESATLLAGHERLQQRIRALEAELDGATLLVRSAEGQMLRLPVAEVVDALWSNQLSLIARLRAFVRGIYSFLSEEPREANTAGGVFPAIFGTVIMVLFMSVLVTPFGVIAAVYLHEYASQNALVHLVRISVNNLAGVPSIVYGVFGLGFFVYVLGGSIDRLFYPDALPSPTFGTGGLLWASLTLTLLTVPVVIVATEEGLARIPMALREGSYALGATRAQTLWRTVLPMASPAIMTGMILAIARAAGEVAPLMLVGVVKMAPALPLDGVAPFLHLERKFMHLGFHIYDVGFQSPNVEATRPLVYATALLLILIIVVLNLTAIVIRNRLRETYKVLE